MDKGYQSKSAVGGTQARLRRARYQPDVESTPLELAMSLRAWNLFELLVAWGANLKQVEPAEVLDTYRVDLMERFWEGGVDYTKDHVLARHLASNSSNRPLYGWAKRHQEIQPLQSG